MRFSVVRAAALALCASLVATSAPLEAYAQVGKLGPAAETLPLPEGPLTVPDATSVAAAQAVQPHAAGRNLEPLATLTPLDARSAAPASSLLRTASTAAASIRESMRSGSVDQAAERLGAFDRARRVLNSAPETNASESSPADFQAEGWRRLGAFAADALGVDRPVQVEEWRRQTAAILASDPTLSLESALAGSFVRLHGLRPDAVSRLEGALRDEGAMTPILATEIGSRPLWTAVLGKTLYSVRDDLKLGEDSKVLSHERSVYVESPGGWVEVSDAELRLSALSALELNGPDLFVVPRAKTAEYAVAGGRLYERSDEGWVLVNRDGGVARPGSPFKAGGKPFDLGHVFLPKDVSPEEARSERFLGVRPASGAKGASPKRVEPALLPDGAWRWTPAPEGWRDGVLRSLRTAKLAGPATVSVGVRSEPDGSMADGRGRMVFSGLASKLLSGLGRLGLAFPDDADPGGSSPPQGARAGGEDDGDGHEQARPKRRSGSVEDQVDELMDKYKVPASDRRLRKKLALQAVERIRLDIAMFSGNPNVDIGFGDWWVTVQGGEQFSHRSIQIPLEDIFVRAVDPRGVEEAVGAAIHETSHYEITRADPNSDLTRKYQTNEHPENNLLYQVIEDSRINTWRMLQEPGTKAYFDAIYEAEWPEDPQAKEALKRARMEVLSNSSFEVEEKDGSKKTWVPPHMQYANSVLYHWRHGKPAPFLTDPAAKEVFEATKEALDRIRKIHPQPIGGVLTEPYKLKASMEALQAIDKEIYPLYEKLVERSQKQLQQLLKNGAKVQQGSGQGQGGGGSGMPNMKMPKQPGQKQKGGGGGGSGQQQQGDEDGEGGQGSQPQEKKDKEGGGGDEEKDAKKLLGDQAKDVAKRIHGSWDPKHAHEHGAGGKDKKKAKAASENGKDGGMGKEESWLERREKAIKEHEKLEKSFTTYERYRLKAKELGLIDKVDGIIKKLLMPTRHARLSRNHYHEGDEPDVDKYLDDRAAGRLDTPIMKLWNRKIRRSAKVSLVLDVSGSMGSLTDEMTSPLDFAVLGIVAWVEVCQRNRLDFEVILFDDGQEIAHPFGRSPTKENKEKLIRAVEQASRGSTDIGAAYKLAIDRLAQQHSTHKFVIFATDEGHNTGDGPSSYKEDAKKAGVVTIAMVIGAESESYEKHFDYAVRVKEARDFPRDLLKVLTDAIKRILGPAWMRLMTVLIAAGASLAAAGQQALSGMGLAFGEDEAVPYGPTAP